ncbi:MAG: sigma-70 family RNA polymerase sigma factor [Clostridiales bacterium]|jgi:RNA polymerase sporulation-specific sigma factor|nr:sigma-70 family RNA polymerase sigma factor [Clostridiales bacterium]
MTDEEVIEEIKAGSSPATDALITKYKSLVKIKAGAYFIVGADKEDIIQEGMIGLFKSIRNFDPARGIPFRVFAEICINRQIIAAVKAGARQKHIPLNSSMPLSRTAALSKKWIADPEQMLICREDRNYIKERLLSALSAMELRILSLRLSGLSYAEIAGRINCGVKSIDNALRRVRRKAEKLLKSE